jgi:DNA-binding transcriptional LysR family regulator
LALIAAQNRSLHRAAEVLNIRQSTLSQTLRGLEYDFGVVLFERTNDGTRPTIVGQEFLEGARRIVEETDAFNARIKTRSRGETGRLTIGVHVSLSTGNLRATLLEHHRRFPAIDTQQRAEMLRRHLEQFRSRRSCQPSAPHHDGYAPTRDVVDFLGL